ncbi:MAG: UDP-N-acetylmuramate dehydrogenase [Treponema sp.]|jgi:UDP-N-acetylmuramate dehydrogenase|nr:UDP-N-acetylmuramate dehydrogenase [Treponema sp.]
MSRLCKFIEKINTQAGFTGELRYDEPLARHTTFKVGGPADVWVRPRGEGFPEYAAALLGRAGAEGIPVFILGGGANLLVADRGVRGIVLDTSGWKGRRLLPGKDAVLVRAGTPVDTLGDELAAENRGGPEFLAGMPGTLGGALWMNARCYERSLSDILIEAEILDEAQRRVTIPRREGDFAYKKSPFQNRPVLILSGTLALEPRSGEDIRREAAEHRRDREAKGHYRCPSAGSAFIYKRNFGKPTGKFIDELGLRGFRVGGAQVAPWHGNMIINTGDALAADIRSLVYEVAARVKAAAGFDLEPEIIFAGDWGD